MVLGPRTHRSLSGWLTGAVFIDPRDPYAGGPDNQPPLALTEAKKVELGLPTPVGPIHLDDHPRHPSTTPDTQKFSFVRMLGLYASAQAEHDDGDIFWKNHGIAVVKEEN